jgi:hypothetical protein
MRDFTTSVYVLLLKAIKESGYCFQTLEAFIEKPGKRSVVLRHDSDIWPMNDLKFAGIENQMGIKSTYYFRVPRTFNLKVIEGIIKMGHEIGYHYEDLSDSGGDFKKAITRFKANLRLLREYYPVKTVAMHGRPFSRWDNRLLWEKHSLLEFGLTGEPYLSIDYNSVLYLTDNGSCWDGYRMNIRDLVNTKKIHSLHSTFQLIDAFKNSNLPDQVILNVHAARWNDNHIIWFYRYLLQKSKNIAKYILKRAIS